MTPIDFEVTRSKVKVTEEHRLSPDSVDGPMLANEKKDKTCLVCGDKALGYNFNAVSCESCKAFFRRNAHKEKSTETVLLFTIATDILKRVKTMSFILYGH
ncbi:hypothetical protein DPMN_002041 [Dreissena polymorpha]|uniref:Nuclear receptor domain-containing protein n=1 Tax=Dreissena polymorpha TaxID=45954 RepID=A0A9D4MMD9_DREPO|nr:hypothetical protein DPMN_002041 [Dreissena polymorpha]